MKPTDCLREISSPTSKHICQTKMCVFCIVLPCLIIVLPTHQLGLDGSPGPASCGSPIHGVLLFTIFTRSKGPQSLGRLVMTGRPKSFQQAIGTWKKLDGIYELNMKLKCWPATQSPSLHVQSTATAPAHRKCEFLMSEGSTELGIICLTSCFIWS